MSKNSKWQDDGGYARLNGGPEHADRLMGDSIAATVEVHTFMYAVCSRFVQTALYLVGTFRRPFSLKTPVAFCTIFLVETLTYITVNNQIRPLISE